MTEAARNMPVLVDPLVGKQLGRYDILHRVAGGGMGSVYIGRARAMGGFERLVAIKVLHPHLAHEEDFITMFLDEARLAARIRHPNVVPTVDVCQAPEAYFLVMDYVEGDHLAGILRAAIDQGAPLKPAIVSRMMVDALAGLSSAHELCDRSGAPLKLVHRDVSPQNLLVGVDGVTRLTDFGVAKAEFRLSSTRDGQLKGKLAYMAPEQASAGEVEQRSDIFAMGVVLWEALAGRRLFKGQTNAEVLQLIMFEPVPAPSSLDPKLAPFDPVLVRALARPVEERYQTAHEMMEGLEKAAAEAGGMASQREVSEVVRRLAAGKLELEGAAIRMAVANASSAPPASRAAKTAPQPGLDDTGATVVAVHLRSQDEMETQAAAPIRPAGSEISAAFTPTPVVAPAAAPRAGFPRGAVIALGAVALIVVVAAIVFAMRPTETTTHVIVPSTPVTPGAPEVTAPPPAPPVAPPVAPVDVVPVVTTAPVAENAPTEPPAEAPTPPANDTPTQRPTKRRVVTPNMTTTMTPTEDVFANPYRNP